MSSPSPIFDRDRLRRNAERRPGPAVNFITELVNNDLDQRLGVISRRFARALVMGPDITALPRHTCSADGPIDLERVATLVPARGVGVIDPENLRLSRTDYDLIVSLLDMQIIDDVPGFLTRVRAHLAPDGLFLGAAIAGNSLKELRTAWFTADMDETGGAFARIAPFLEVRAAGDLLQRAGFGVPVADIDTLTVRYPSPLALMRELKGFGAANPLSERPRRPVTKSWLARACNAYRAAASAPGGRIGATLEILWMSGWAPHSSQQKPLAPGSAKISLATVLGPGRPNQTRQE